MSIVAVWFVLVEVDVFLTGEVVEKQRKYTPVRFTVAAIEEAVSSLAEDANVTWSGCMVHRGRDKWDLDTKEEFFAEYRRGYWQTTFYVSISRKGVELAKISFWALNPDATFSIRADEQWRIDKFFNVLDGYEASCRIPEKPQPLVKPIVFIGHGRSTQWRDLKDHLHEQHGLDVEAYETGARAGHVIRDVLEQMLNTSTFALLVLTAEDEMADGSLRPRENVVHEAGLFQGKLGFARAILLVEEGVEPFSNLQGVTQIRYSRGNIKEVYGDVLATIRREFSGL